MSPSKENCRHALENLEGQERFMNAYAFKTIRDFLQAAEKRLPTQAALDADKERSKGRKTKARG